MVDVAEAVQRRGDLVVERIEGVKPVDVDLDRAAHFANLRRNFSRRLRNRWR